MRKTRKILLPTASSGHVTYNENSGYLNNRSQKPLMNGRVKKKLQIAVDLILKLLPSCRSPLLFWVQLQLTGASGGKTLMCSQKLLASISELQMVFIPFNETGILHGKKYKANNRHECTLYTERTLVFWLEVAEAAFFYLRVFFMCLKICFMSNFQGLIHKGNRRMN